MIEPVPRRIWYYYGEYQHAFNNYASVHFEEGLPQLSDEVFDGSEPSMIVIDDQMSCNINTKYNKYFSAKMPRS